MQSIFDQVKIRKRANVVAKLFEKFSFVFVFGIRSDFLGFGFSVSSSEDFCSARG